MTSPSIPCPDMVTAQATIERGWWVVDGRPVCDGSRFCKAPVHTLGCFNGKVSDPDDSALTRTGAPAEWLAAAEPCETCDDGSGCDIANCQDCGEEYLEPCDRHLAAGHQPSHDPYGDDVECSTCCPDCLGAGKPRIEVTAPCPNMARGRCNGGYCFQCDVLGAVNGIVHVGLVTATEVLPVLGVGFWDNTTQTCAHVYHGEHGDGVETMMGGYKIADITAEVAHLGPPADLVNRYLLHLEAV